ncbi:MAG: hypothetical protein WEA75_06870 [Acidimicrobiia bacterium]
MRRSLTLLAALTLVLTTLVVGPAVRSAHACSCVAQTDSQAFGQADAVFVGRVTGHTVESSGATISSIDPATWTFSVSEVFKGKVAQRQEVVSPSSGASCGLEVAEGHEYLVFAWLDGVFPEESQPGPGQLAASLCNGTRSTDDGPLDVKGARAREPRAEPADDVVVSGLVRIDDARLGDSPRTVVVDFVGAPKAPKSSACWEGYRARVGEESFGVVITIRRLRHTAPPKEPIACPDIGAFRTLKVTLRQPLGDRPVIDGVTGSEFG